MGICTFSDPCSTPHPLFFCLYQCLAKLSLIVCVYIRFLIRVFSLSLSLWMPVLVSGYIITHCMCICTFLDPRFSLSFSLQVCIRIRLYCHSLYVYNARFLIRFPPFFLFLFFSSLFLSKCPYQWPTIVITHCMCICTSLDLSVFLSLFLSEGLF